MTKTIKKLTDELFYNVEGLHSLEIDGVVTYLLNNYEIVPKSRLTIEEIRGVVAQGWCTSKNKHKEMDVDLAESIAEAIISSLKGGNEDDRR